jgi:hypothetical protein
MSFIGRATALSVHPGYVAGNWYCPWAGCSAANGAIQANSIALIPFTIAKQIKVSDLGTRVTTVSAGGNFQLALYAHNPVTGKPTGGALCSTGNMSTAALAMVSAAVNAAATLPPGTYWHAINCDNAVAGFQCLSNAAIWAEALIGSSVLANMFPAAGTAPLSLRTAQAFGAWPDLTAVNPAVDLTATYAIGLLKAA